MCCSELHFLANIFSDRCGTSGLPICCSVLQCVAECPQIDVQRVISLKEPNIYLKKPCMLTQKNLQTKETFFTMGCIVLQCVLQYVLQCAELCFSVPSDGCGTRGNSKRAQYPLERALYSRTKKPADKRDLLFRWLCGNSFCISSSLQHSVGAVTLPHVYIHICLQMYTCIYMYIHACTYIYTYECIYICIYMHLQIRIHTQERVFCVLRTERFTCIFFFRWLCRQQKSFCIRVP